MLHQKQKFISIQSCKKLMTIDLDLQNGVNISFQNL